MNLGHPRLMNHTQLITEELVKLGYLIEVDYTNPNYREITVRNGDVSNTWRFGLDDSPENFIQGVIQMLGACRCGNKKEEEGSIKFKIISTAWCELEKMIKHYPQLKDFGFTIEKTEEPKICKIHDENGNMIEYEYGCKTIYTPYVQIGSLQDLFRLRDSVGYELIICQEENTIEIYDGYRE